MQVLSPRRSVGGIGNPYDSMHFESGKFGAVVVVIALCLTVVIGTCTDVTKVEVERTDFDYITDITGLFETEQVPEFIEYSPNSNFVGYSGPVVYTTSNQPNNYRYVVSEGTSSTLQGVTVNRNSNFGAPYNYDDGYVYSFPCYYSGSTYDMGGPAYVGPQKLYNLTSNSNTTTDLGKILASLVPSIETYDTVEISVNQNSTWPCFMYPYSAIEKISNAQAWVVLTDANVITRITVNPVTLVATAYAGSSISFSCPANQFFVQEGYTTIKDGSGASMSATLTPTVTTPPTYGYADPQGGVRLTEGTVATWSNGYQIEEIKILIGKYNFPQQSAMYISFYDSPGSSFDYNLWVSISSNGVSITVYDHAYNGNSISMGKWTAVEISYNRITGVIMATPVGTVLDYTETPMLRGEPVQLTTGWSASESVPQSSSFTFSTGARVPSPYFGVTYTSVFLNTYGVVMNDPSISIRDYWPDLEQYRLNFYSFALVGDSITLNGVNYPIGPDQTITVIDADGDEYTRTLTNIYVTTEEGHTYLTFVNDNLSLDLGETVTETISFSGLWYFTTALYEVIQTTGYEYEWTVDGTYSATAQQTLVIFLGLLVAGVLIGKVLIHHEFGMFDWLLIVGAGVVAFSMAGVFF